jgi:phosphoribosylamine-glycine ligase
VNCIVDDKKAYALESTSRFGYDAIEALSEGLREPLTDLLYGCAIGTKKKMDITGDAMMSVRLTIPPWPNKAPGPDDYGEPIGGITDAALKHLYLEDVYLDKQGVYRTAGAEGIILKATATGRTSDSNGKPDYTREAARRCYRLLDTIKIGSAQYRTDIGKRVNDDYATLLKQGWI